MRSMSADVFIRGLFHDSNLQWVRSVDLRAYYRPEGRKPASSEDALQKIVRVGGDQQAVERQIRERAESDDFLPDFHDAPLIAPPAVIAIYHRKNDSKISWRKNGQNISTPV